MLTCQDFLSQQEAYYEGQLDRVQQRRTDAHLRDCTSCRQAYEETFTRRVKEEGGLFQVTAGNPFPNCLTEATLKEYVDGLLDQKEEAYVHDHVAECSECRKTQDELNKKPE